jgi:MYXO-CTERM domain-containing protein
MNRPCFMNIFLAAGLVGLGSTPTQAAKPSARWFTQLSGPAIVGPSTAGPVTSHAAEYLMARADALALDGVQLGAAPRVRTWRGHRVVRFDQEYEGLPVFGRGALVRLDRQGRVSTVVNFAARGLDVIPLHVVTATEAHRTAAGLWARDRLGGTETLLGILDDGRRGLVAWRVDGNLATGRVRTFIDAVTGEPLRSFSLARQAPGRVYRANPIATPVPEVLELGNLTGDGTYLEGRAGTVFHYVAGSVEDFAAMELDQLATSDGTGFFYQAHPSDVLFDDPFTEVNLYYHLDHIDSYFRDVHGHTPLLDIMVVANYGEGPGQPYNNAFSTPLTTALHGLFFGQGTSVDYGLDGDVVYHEFTHFVIDELTQMGYMDALFDTWGMHFAPGGIHEGLADYFSSTVMNESTTGEYAMGASGARDLVNDLVCPDDVFGEPHQDGRIVGGVTWEIRQTLGASDLADGLIFGALTMLSSLATFEDFAAALNDTAAAMQSDGDLSQTQTDAVAQVLDARGMTRCGRNLPLDDGAQQTTHPFGFDWLSTVVNSECETVRVLGIWMPGAFQYRIDVPNDAQQLTVRLRQSPNDRLLTRILFRRADPIEYTVQPIVMGLSVVYPKEFDHEFGEFEGDDVSVTVDVLSEPPLQPGETYYVSVLHQNCPDSEQIVSASTSTDAPTPDGSIDTPPDDPGRGCTCATTRDAPPLPLILLIALALLGLRRRR